MPAWSSAASRLRYRFGRVRATELMDLPGADPAERAEALKGIERLSLWPGQRAPLLKAIVRMLGKPKPGRLKLIEVGAGSGHLSRWISAELVSRGYNAELLATDLFAQGDVAGMDCLDPELPEADLYFSSLLLHHLPDADVASMLRLQASKARIGLVHFELQRSFWHFYLAKAMIGQAGFQPMNQVDALLSIQQGFTRRELRALAGPEAQIQWSFPFRWLLTWRK